MLQESADFFRRVSTKSATPGQFTSSKPGAATLTADVSLQDASDDEIVRAGNRQVEITHVLYTEIGIDVEENDLIEIGTFNGRVTGRINAPGRDYGKFGVLETQSGEVGN